MSVLIKVLRLEKCNLYPTRYHSMNSTINALLTDGNNIIPAAASNNFIHVSEREIYLQYERKKCIFCLPEIVSSLKLMIVFRKPIYYFK